MLKDLKFVQGAISKKDFVPALGHFCIMGGRVLGFNGKLSLSSPIDMAFDCCPNARDFYNAIDACDETAELSLIDDDKRIRIKSGNFTTHVETIPLEAYPQMAPEGERLELEGELLPALRLLSDFIGEDASRPWCTGISLDGPVACATNNIVLVQYWLGFHFPYRLVLPGYAIDELLRINEEPVSVQASGNSITFFYKDDRWVRSQLINEDPPDFDELLNSLPVAETKIPQDFFTELAKLKPFVDAEGRVHMDDAGLCAGPLDGVSVSARGTRIEMDGLAECVLNHRMLSKLENIATCIQFDAYPKVPFRGKNLRGVIMGMK